MGLLIFFEFQVINIQQKTVNCPWELWYAICTFFVRKVNLTRSRFSEDFLYIADRPGAASFLTLQFSCISLSVRVKQHLHLYDGINIETGVGQFFNFVIIAISGFLKSFNWSGEISLIDKEPPVLSLALLIVLRITSQGLVYPGPYSSCL